MNDSRSIFVINHSEVNYDFACIALDGLYLDVALIGLRFMTSLSDE